MGNVASTTSRKLRTSVLQGEKTAVDNLKKLSKDDKFSRNININEKFANRKRLPNANTSENVINSHSIKAVSDDAMPHIPQRGFLERAISLGIVKVNKEPAKFDKDHESLQQLRSRKQIQEEYKILSDKTESDSVTSSSRSFIENENLKADEIPSHSEPKRTKFLNPKDLTNLLRSYKHKVDVQNFQGNQETLDLVEEISKEFNLAKETSSEVIELIDKQFIRLPHLVASIEPLPSSSNPDTQSAQSQATGENSRERIVIIDTNRSEAISNRKSKPEVASNH